MKNNRWINLCGLFAGVLLMALFARAEVLVNDPFTDGDLTNGTDAQDVTWYGIWNANGTMPVVTDYSGDYKLTAPISTAYNTRMLANFTPYTLSNAGDSIQITADFSSDSTLNADGSGVRLGLLSDKGTTLTENCFVTSTNILKDDIGYFAKTFLGNFSGDIEYRPPKGTDGLLAATTGAALATGNSGLSFVYGTTPQEIGFRITRETGGTLELTSWVGANSNTVTGITASTYEFTEAFFCTEGATRYRIDNINVTAIPEPSSISLIVISAAGILLRSFRSRK